MRGVVLVLVACVAWLLGGAPVSARAARLSFSLARHATPARMCPGEPRHVPVTLDNDGELGWQPSQKDKLAYHWLDEGGAMVVFEGERTELPGEVAPGDSVDLDARVVAPDTAGHYRLVFAMVREGVRWYPPAPEIEVEVAGTAPPLALDARAIDAPQAWGAGERAAVSVHLWNSGCAAWSPEQGDALTYRFRDPATAEVVVAEGIRTPLPDTPRDEHRRVTADVEAPMREGRYVLELAGVREHLGWFHDPLGDGASIDVRIGPSPLRWSYAMTEALPRLSAGDRVDVPMRLTNAGTRAWSHAAGDRLSYRVRKTTGELLLADGLRTRLPQSVPPGASVDVVARLEAPNAAGRYVVHWEMVREGERWYGPPIQGADGIAVQVGPPRLSFALLAADPPAWVWTDRPTTMRVTLKNDGTDAWSDTLGDRLSYHWRDEAGRIVVGEGDRTRLLADVAPGATVTLDMRIVGPPVPGRHRLELDMVREHVTWFRGSRSGQPSTLGVGAYRLADALLLGLGLLVVAGVLVRRELIVGRPGAARRRVAAVLDLAYVPAWTAACVFLVAETFVDYGGVPMWPGGRAVSASGAFLLSLPLFAIPSRARGLVALALVAGLVALALADLGYMHFFGSIVPLTAVAAVHHLGDASETVASLMRPEYAWLSMLPISGLVLVIAWPRAGSRPARRLTWLVAGVFAIGAAPAAGRLVDATSSELGVKVFSEQNNVGRLGLVNAHLFELSRGLVALVSGPSALSAEARGTVEAFYEEKQRARAEPTPGTGAARSGDPGRPTNVLLVQVEALQGWAVEARVGEKAVMPFLAGAADDDALWFRRIHDQTSQGRTSDAEYLALASNHPLSVGALSFLRADDHFRTLAHVVADSGGSTLSAHPYKRGFWNRAVLHPRYGFARSLFRRELGDGPVIGWGLADAAFFERLVPHLAAAPEPFFAFAITLSLHHPYESFPPAFEVLDLGELQGTPVGNYLHAMHHFDGALRQLLQDLDDAGLLDHTLVVVYGDHVSRLGAPSEVLALAGLEGPWDPSVPTRLHRVPVFAWVPGGAARGLVGARDRVGGQIDIGPTILDLLGQSNALPSAVGRSLLSTGPGFAALSDGSAVGDELMFVADGRDVPRGGACFDTTTGATHPREACADLAARARAELQASRTVLDHDLFAEIGEH